MKQSTRVLKEADPNLRVVSGGRRKAAKPSSPDSQKSGLTEEDWEKAKGEICPVCGKEALRGQRTPGGLICMSCYPRWLETYNELRKKGKLKGRLD